MKKILFVFGFVLVVAVSLFVFPQMAMATCSDGSDSPPIINAFTATLNSASNPTLLALHANVNAGELCGAGPQIYSLYLSGGIVGVNMTLIGVTHNNQQNYSSYLNFSNVNPPTNPFPDYAFDISGLSNGTYTVELTATAAIAGTEIGDSVKTATFTINRSVPTGTINVMTETTDGKTGGAVPVPVITVKKSDGTFSASGTDQIGGGASVISNNAPTGDYYPLDSGITASVVIDGITYVYNPDHPSSDWLNGNSLLSGGSITYKAVYEPQFTPLTCSVTAPGSSNLLVENNHTFTGTASGGSGSYAYNWNFGDGNSALGASVTHKYLRDTIGQTKNLSLTVIDSANHQCSSSRTITPFAHSIELDAYVKNNCSDSSASSMGPDANQVQIPITNPNNFLIYDGQTYVNGVHGTIQTWVLGDYSAQIGAYPAGYTPCPQTSPSAFSFSSKENPAVQNVIAYFTQSPETSPISNLIAVPECSGADPRIRVSFTAQASNPAMYRIFRNTTNNMSSAVAVANAALIGNGDNVFVDNNVSNGITYYYWVQLYNGYDDVLGPALAVPSCGQIGTGTLLLNAAVKRAGTSSYVPLDGNEGSIIRVTVGSLSGVQTLGSKTVNAGSYGPFAVTAKPDSFTFDYSVPSNSVTVNPDGSATITFYFSDSNSPQKATLNFEASVKRRGAQIYTDLTDEEAFEVIFVGSCLTGQQRLGPKTVNPGNCNSFTIITEPTFLDYESVSPSSVNLDPGETGTVTFRFIEPENGGSPSCSVSANPISGNAPLDVSAEALGNGGTAPYQFKFDWESDGNWDVLYPSQNPENHTYSNPETYRITAGIKDAEGRENVCDTQATATNIVVGGTGVDLKINGSDGPVIIAYPPGSMFDTARLDLTWQSHNVSSCSAERVSPSNDWSGDVGINGSKTSWIFEGNYDYKISCTPSPAQNRDNVEVNFVRCLPGDQRPACGGVITDECSISADPTSILIGQSSRLSWSCSNPGVHTCSIDNGVGNVPPTGGERTVKPSRTTTYTLSCENPVVPDSSVTIRTGFLPIIREILPR